MQFKLTVNGDGVRKPDTASLIDAIENLCHEHDSFIVLEPKKPIDNNIYIQCIYGIDDVYVVETRFILSSDTDFKHYQYITTDVEEVKSIFLDYFTSHKIPPVHNWIEDGLTVGENEEMIKCYKEITGKLHYFECWISGDDELTLHKGMVGEIGEVETITLGSNGMDIHLQILTLLKECEENGYEQIENLTELVVQYKSTGKETQDQEKLENVEDLINECLGWTGNGHCEGGDVSDNKINIFCQVVLKDIALATIIETLKDNDLFADVRIAYADEDIEDYVLLHPQLGSFML